MQAWPGSSLGRDPQLFPSRDPAGHLFSTWLLLLALSLTLQGFMVSCILSDVAMLSLSSRPPLPPCLPLAPFCFTGLVCLSFTKTPGQ